MEGTKTGSGDNVKPTSTSPNTKDTNQSDSASPNATAADDDKTLSNDIERAKSRLREGPVFFRGRPLGRKAASGQPDDASAEELVMMEAIQKYVEIPIGPLPVDVANAARKEKEVKKNAEKAAKMKKFLEKKEQAKVVKPTTTENKAATKEKAKPSPKEKSGDVDNLKNLECVAPGTKKPTEVPLPDAYDPKYVEALWYPWWVSEGFFKPEYGLGEETLEQAIERRGKFVMVIPPPNVTGILHLGHALTSSFEDVITRWNRMRGKVTLWVPGCDHAGIATQMVVEKTLARTEGVTRHDLGREKFIKKVWEWKEQKGGRIYEQFKRMGISADWDRAVFTMDEKLCKAVTRAFILLHDWGFIYRSDRLVNWSCTLKSCISDIEVDKMELTGRTFLSVPGYKDKVEFGVLTSFAYKLEDGTDIIVATTRPETMLGDVAIAVHPLDERYKAHIGKKGKHPFVDRDLPIIADDFVDREFGTGCVKITPAHDPNDYEVGKRHSLEFVTVIDEDGNMMDNCGKFSKMKRFDARKAVLESLTDLGLFHGTIENPMVVPVCSRSKDIVEPLLKMQWYVNCAHMAKDALDIVKEEKLRIIPEMHVKTWNFWMEGIRDWCISRQLWWGHQIPAYRVKSSTIPEQQEIWIVAESEAEAVEKAKGKYPDTPDLVVVRDEDVLDTWFSSGLFPFSVFGWPDVDNQEFNLFYPTDFLETGYDILFFWVARMVFMGMSLTKTIPFKDVFLHSLVRDAHGRKMSKSLGNIIDPVDVIQGISLADLQKGLEDGNLDPKEVEKAKQGQKQDYPNGIPECGTDALRFALCACMTLGRDMNLDVLRVQGYRFFCNKIWNAVKFSMRYLATLAYTPSERTPMGSTLSNFDRMDRWILSGLGTLVRIVNEALEKYDFQTAANAMHSFWLYDLCDVYLESVKPKLSTDATKLTPAQQQHLDVLLFCIDTGLRLLAPFMPFITEELWQRLPVFGEEFELRAPSLAVAKYPHGAGFEALENEKVMEEVAFLNKLVHSVRSARSVYNIPHKVKTDVLVLNTDDGLRTVVEEDYETIAALAFSNMKVIHTKDKVPAGSAASIVSDKCTAYIVLKGLIDPVKEVERLGKKLTFAEQQLTKLKQAKGRLDYETKVPIEIREVNGVKMETLESEIKELCEVIASVKLMAAE